VGVKVTTTTRSGKISNFLDVESLIAEIRQTGDRAVKGVSDVVRDEGEKVQELARDMAPHDDGYLEAAIKVEESKSTQGRDVQGRFTSGGGRLQVTVYVDGDMPGSHDRKTVGDYALLMHEGLSPYGDGTYKPGEGTLAKIYAGMKAGGKFLERALRERRKHLIDRSAAIVKRIIGR